MSGMSAAFRYAKALYEVSQEQQAMLALQADMQAITRILEGAPEIRDYCLEPKHQPKDVAEFVELAFCAHVHELTQRALRLVAENGRLSVIPHLPAAIERIRQDAGEIEKVVLETVQDAEAGLKDEVTARMRQRTGKDIELENRLNASLIAGFRVLWRDRLIDNSASGRINALRQRLRASKS